MKVIRTIIGRHGGELKESIRQIFEFNNNDKELESISQKMQKTELRESESLTEKVLSR